MDDAMTELLPDAMKEVSAHSKLMSVDIFPEREVSLAFGNLLLDNLGIHSRIMHVHAPHAECGARWRANDPVWAILLNQLECKLPFGLPD